MAEPEPHADPISPADPRSVGRERTGPVSPGGQPSDPPEEGDPAVLGDEPAPAVGSDVPVRPTGVQIPPTPITVSDEVPAPVSGAAPIVTPGPTATAEPAAAERDYGRAGRNLPMAIGVGVGIAIFVVLSLIFFNAGFVGVVALGLALASIELHQNFRRRGVHASITPIVVGTVMIVVGSYVAGITRNAGISNIAILLGALALTVIASLLWRIPRGADGYLADVTASLFIIAYIPLLGSFVALMLADENGAARVVTFILVVVMGDVGGYVAGVLFGKHPMAPRISPKKSWEGFAGSVLLGTVAAVAMAVLGLGVPYWVGLILGPCLVCVGVVGDLVESMIKRDLKIKDMSSFLPGHGGVMDRIDSLLLAAPVGWLIMTLLVRA